MQKTMMKSLTMAVGIALGGLGVLPSAQAVYVSANNLGQALIFPYYTVRGGWMTLFGVTNTSALTVAVKVRFREAYNSRDVFDFNIILSPYDVWTGWVADAGDRPALFSEDKSCTVGAMSPNGIPFTDGLNTYTGTAADGGPTTPDRMKEGYVEMIMMGAANVVTPAGTPDLTPLARGAIHVNGVPTNCQALIDAFTNYNQLGTAGMAPTAGFLRGEFQFYGVDPTSNRSLNPLKGTFALVNGAKGLNAVGLPVHLEGYAWRADRDVLDPGIFMTSQLPKDEAGGKYYDSYNEPSLGSRYQDSVSGYLQVHRNYNELIFGQRPIPAVAFSHNTAGAVRTTGALEAVGLLNEWSRRTNAAAGWVTATDWVITFPTKHFFVDNDPDNEYAGRNSFRGNAVAAPGLTADDLTPFSQSFVDTAASPVVRRGKSCDSVSYQLRNREEQRSTTSLFSPSGSSQMCYEANVLTFNKGAILESPIAQSINYPENFTFGWLNVRFSGANAANMGLPAVGFGITSRDDGSSTLLSEAGLYNHTIVRPAL
ncbi:exported hypothetical protein [Candidatus Competibacter denitrificans Run_A_D11]|uniref:Uncharacterized protein n=2 Tax=Candidatus Competibacter TaxID=221279 RepID=W6M3E8_9GAMM|nr:exported hypothetical protein [Candidatus Competibacter denitrificans Run_A_D11]HAS86039.1 hypothetical protein [Candidatus Competibacteraceae bacterium]HRC68457.1 hypothetical protein [Candidatus Competibacter denitrificans]